MKIIFAFLIAAATLLSDPPPIKGIALFGNQPAMRRIKVNDVQGIEAFELKVPGGIKKLRLRLKPYLNQPLTKKEIYDIKRDVVLFYAYQNRPVVMVQVLKQDISDGVLSLLVTESKLGSVGACGANWFNNERIADAITLDPGGVIDQKTILRNLEWLNRNPFRITDVVYSPGEMPGTTDIVLMTKDRFPLRTYAGAENSGLQETGSNRFFTGFNWGNVFNLGHVLSAQYTTTNNPKEFQAGTVNYTAPLSWQHTLYIYGGYSYVKARTPFTGFTNNGFSAQASGRYEIPIRPFNRWLNQITFGFDFKRTNNNVQFDEFPVFGKNVNLSQFALRYDVSFESRFNKFAMSGEIFFQPTPLMGDESLADYQSLRLFANNKYLYGQFYLVDILTLPLDFSLHGLIRAQLSTANLLPSEQFGIGGYNTVRGYIERQITSDNAFLASGEVRSPVFNPLRCYKIDDKLQFLAFIDYGIGHNHKLIPGEKYSYYLLGAGPGVRYFINEYVTTRADCGFRIHRDHFAGPEWGRVHFSVILSY